MRKTEKAAFFLRFPQNPPHFPDGKCAWTITSLTDGKKQLVLHSNDFFNVPYAPSKPETEQKRNPLFCSCVT